ncbi:MAG: flagellar protein FlgN [Chloroflexi bacterium]|nr:flagellar protein FlgN [Chloroflexota bacterium]
MDSESAELLDRILRVLGQQEAALTVLVGLAFEEQHALVVSDFAAIERVSAEMLATSETIDALDAERQRLVNQLGTGATLSDLLPVADNLGVTGFTQARERLMARAKELREAQEANARLILNAVKLRERWYGLIAGMSSPTYGAAGRQEFHQGRDIVSRSA